MLMARRAHSSSTQNEQAKDLSKKESEMNGASRKHSTHTEEEHVVSSPPPSSVPPVLSESWTNDPAAAAPDPNLMAHNSNPYPNSFPTRMTETFGAQSDPPFSKDIKHDTPTAAAVSVQPPQNVDDTKTDNSNVTTEEHTKQKRKLRPEDGYLESKPAKRLPPIGPIKLDEDDFHPPYSPISPGAKAEWKGWVEVESEPVHINSMIRDLGVPGVKVEEIYDIEEAISNLQAPVYGFIFLFQYQEADYDDTGTACPDHVWFSNQLPASNACASIALLNILLNAKNVDLGRSLSFLKEDTMHLTPMERAHCVNEHEFIRKVHNAFASRMDMWLTDICFHYKYLKQKSDARKREIERLKAQEAKIRQKTVQAEGDPKAQPKRKARGKGKRAESEEEDEKQPEYNEDSGFHYVAYVPIKGDIWRLDGLNKNPQKLGPYSSDESWLYDAAPFIQSRMADYAKLGVIEFNLMALVEAPIIRATRSLAENVKSLLKVEKQLDRDFEGWRQVQVEEIDRDTLNGPCIHHGLTDDFIANATEMVLKKHLGLEELLELRLQVAKEQKCFREIIQVQQVKEILEVEQVMKDKQDLNPTIHKILLDLEKAGVAQELMTIHQY